MTPETKASLERNRALAQIHQDLRNEFGLAEQSREVELGASKIVNVELQHRLLFDLDDIDTLADLVSTIEFIQERAPADSQVYLQSQSVDCDCSCDCDYPSEFATGIIVFQWTDQSEGKSNE